MPNVYLYLSTAKLDQLLDQESSFFTNITAKIDFKIPFVSGGLSGTTNTRKNIAKMGRLEATLRKKYSIPNFDEIPAESSPVFISFKGRAVRTVQDKEFWLAVDHPKVALLLAGSASFTLGEQIKDPVSFSTSADPVGAFVKAFKKSSKKVTDPSVSSSLSYVWISLLSDAIRSHANLPSVEGIAVFATTSEVEGGFSEVRRPYIEKIVVGTPLYVRQTEYQPEPTSGVETSLLESRKKVLVSVLSISNLERGDRIWDKKVDSLAYTLHCLGYRILDGKHCSSSFFLSEYKRTGRWTRAFVLFRPDKREVAEQVRSFIDENEDFPSELISLEDAVKENGKKNEKWNETLIADDVDVSVAICFDRE
ncbi:hypothetical protein [Paraburkholderia sp. BL10I2N1]|uniref:DUF7019 family protein n=1 Tax=Paraburkholderia sp. BL10I2N1 TaxID=1938796 RepID=UPI00105C3270|nr:hypothetical protein [Paraburkholderia sp. BL10I2N1]TDN58969.1 hypothetical protein B0G77_8151 [Paraburkholderia sp. BL10I2N1]